MLIESRVGVKGLPHAQITFSYIAPEEHLMESCTSSLGSNYHLARRSMLTEDDQGANELSEGVN